MLDVDMESVGSRLSRSHDLDSACRDQRNKRLPQVATATAAGGGEFSNHMIQMYFIAKLKEFARRENNEE